MVATDVKVVNANSNNNEQAYYVQDGARQCYKCYRFGQISLSTAQIIVILFIPADHTTTECPMRTGQLHTGPQRYYPTYVQHNST